MNVIEHNREAWNRESAEGSEWSTPVDSKVIRAARDGIWTVILTPTRAVPASWFGELRGKNVLCLASGGGQQAPVLAAAGANVVSFDLIFHPVSNVFVPDVMVVWRGCYRVLKPGGRLLAGFMNPSFFLFDHEEAEQSGVLVVKYHLPYAEPDSLHEDARQRWKQSGSAAQFSHSLESQIGGQIAAGFAIVGFYEDSWSDEATPLNRFSPVAMVTLAVKVTSNNALHADAP